MIKRISIILLCTALLFFSCDLNGGSDDVPVTSVSCGQSGAIMLAGATYQLNVIITPEDATNKNVSYSSNNTSIATVNETGLITAIAEGNAVVSVTAEDGGITADFNVSVNVLKTNVESISLDKSAIALIPGSSETITARILPTSAINKNIVWSESDASDAITIAADGSSVTVTAAAVGNATVTATMYGTFRARRVMADRH